MCCRCPGVSRCCRCCRCPCVAGVQVCPGVAGVQASGRWGIFKASGRPGIQVSRCSGVQVSRVCWCPGALVCRCPVVQVSRQVPRSGAFPFAGAVLIFQVPVVFLFFRPCLLPSFTSRCLWCFFLQVLVLLLLLQVPVLFLLQLPVLHLQVPRRPSSSPLRCPPSLQVPGVCPPSRCSPAFQVSVLPPAFVRPPGRRSSFQQFVSLIGRFSVFPTCGHFGLHPCCAGGRRSPVSCIFCGLLGVIDVN